uniref:Kinesin motor domain-containing protein n=1 Tax=Podarcis muralis TaxID=64176 RepID=A0A670JML3_PODMU
MCACPKRVSAFARVKPTGDFPQDMIKFGEDNKTMEIYIERDRTKGVVNNKQTDWSFKLDGVLHDAPQDAVYDAVARDLVSQALNGYNGKCSCHCLCSLQFPSRMGAALHVCYFSSPSLAALSECSLRPCILF